MSFLSHSSSLLNVRKVLEGNSIYPPPVGCLFPSPEDYKIGLQVACHINGWEWIGVLIKQSDYLPYERPPSLEERKGLMDIFKIGIAEGPFQKRLSHRGIEAFLCPPNAEKIFFEDYQEIARLIREQSKNFDAFLIADDVSADRPMISSEYFYKLFKPGLDLLGETCRELGKLLGFHSDGNFYIFLEILKSAGVSFLHGLYPLNFKQKELESFVLILPKNTPCTSLPILWEDPWTGPRDFFN